MIEIITGSITPNTPPRPHGWPGIHVRCLLAQDLKPTTKCISHNGGAERVNALRLGYRAWVYTTLPTKWSVEEENGPNMSHRAAWSGSHQNSSVFPPVPWPGLDVSWNLQRIESNVTTESPHLECGLDVCYSPWRCASLLCLVWWWHQNSLKAITKKVRSTLNQSIHALPYFGLLSPPGERRWSISLWGFKSNIARVFFRYVFAALTQPIDGF